MNFIMEEILSNSGLDPNPWKKCKKNIYSISMYVPEKGTKVYNSLENSDYTTDEKKPYVLVGTVGEEWTIDYEKLKRTYTYEGKELTLEILKELSDEKKYKITVKDDSPVQWCRKAVDKEKIKTSWGETLEANRDGIPNGKGDYVVATDKNGKPNEKDSWIVNGAVFTKTYKII